jgi:exopolysaccharide production protein ExoZ
MAGANRYASIQYLRAFAVLLVIFHHARNPKPWLHNALQSYTSGEAGVDIFFLISGFIMFTAARNEHYSDFLKRRVIRIMPMYWLATMLHSWSWGIETRPLEPERCCPT